jgi:hypothetical protein
MAENLSVRPMNSSSTNKIGRPRRSTTATNRPDYFHESYGSTVDDDGKENSKRKSGDKKSDGVGNNKKKKSDGDVSGTSTHPSTTSTSSATSTVSSFVYEVGAKKSDGSDVSGTTTIPSSNATTLPSIIDGSGAKLTTSTTNFDISNISNLTDEMLDKALMGLEGEFDPIAGEGPFQYKGVKQTRNKTTYSAQIRMFGRRFTKSGMTMLEAGIWYAKAKCWCERQKAIESKPIDPNSKQAQKNVINNPSDYGIVTTLSLLEDSKYRLKHDEYHNQGLAYDQLRNTDVLLGHTKLALEAAATVTFRKEVWDKFGGKTKICVTDPDLINFSSELFNKRRVRLMEAYKDDNGNSVWGSIGDETDILRYISLYLRDVRYALARKKTEDDVDDEDD